MCKYFTLDEHTFVPDALLISSRVWKALAPQQQEWLQKAVDDSITYQKTLWQTATADALMAMEKEGLEIIRPDKQPFMDAVSQLKASYSGTIVADLLTSIEAHRAAK